MLIFSIYSIIHLVNILKKVKKWKLLKKKRKAGGGRKKLNRILKKVIVRLDVDIADTFTEVCTRLEISKQKFLENSIKNLIKINLCKENHETN